MDDDVRHPVIVDPDALIAVANTSLWIRLTSSTAGSVEEVNSGEPLDVGSHLTLCSSRR